MEEADCRDSYLKGESELEVRQERTGDKNLRFAKQQEALRQEQPEGLRFYRGAVVSDPGNGWL
jgi:hypothetical protein